MSLRLRLIALVAIALVVSLAVGAGIACFNASRSVGTEMRAALLVGVHTVENAAASIRASPDPRRDLLRLVSLFEGNRHLRVSVAGNPSAIAVPIVEESPFGQAPNWFVRLIGVPSETARVPIALPGGAVAAVRLDTNPRNETLDVWNDFNNTLIVLVLFSGSTMLLIYLFIGRALRPLYRLSAALEQIGLGDYATRIGGRLTPELARLHDSLNRMAGQLAAADADNRRLNEQLLTLPEQERGEIARDLHDEVGPYLFAINIDTATVARLLKEGRAADAAGHLPMIAEAVGHMQRELRGVLRRLRPVGLAEFGLHDAIEDMIGFWRRRHPDIEFGLTVDGACDGFGEPLDTTVYRIVQEGVSNALRHGRPAAVTVEIAHTDDRIVVEIADDGRGLPEAPEAGFGLRGMGERVKAIGGNLTLRNRPGGGLAVTATLSCRPAVQLATTTSEAAPR